MRKKGRNQAWIKARKSVQFKKPTNGTGRNSKSKTMVQKHKEHYERTERMWTSKDEDGGNNGTQWGEKNHLKPTRNNFNTI